MLLYVMITLRRHLLLVAASINGIFIHRGVWNRRDHCFDLRSDAPPTEDAAEKREAAEAVKNALRELPVFQRDVLILRFYHDLPFKDIARIMDCRLSSTKSRYRQGMDKLRDLLERTYGHGG
jgi:RNA polymerase sigma factor (sigma-70 family)